jgi:hypothetical protein
LKINLYFKFHLDKDRKGKAIVAMLLEYYSNNAEKNTGDLNILITHL